MLIRQVDVRRFCALKNATVSCRDLTALVGRNGTGKSSVLRALELFYNQSAKVTAQDFYAENVSYPIEIAITFTDLTGEEARLFASYIHHRNLTIEKVFSELGKPGVYYGKRLQHPDFVHIRGAGSKSEANAAYKRFVSENPKYASLSVAPTYDRVIEELERWEAANPAKCQLRRDDGKFFRFTGVGQGYLGRHTKFIRIQAVRDALEDATEKRGSSVTEIMDILVREALAARPEITTFREQVKKDYGEVFGPSSRVELKALQTELTDTMSQYAPNAAIALDWTGLDEFEPPMPRAEVRVSEDGFEAAVERTGHGVQRAFIMTMLQHLEAAREGREQRSSGVGSKQASTLDGYSGLPSLMLAIEEPELYQHPSRQRHMAAVLRRLAEGATQGLAGKTQVMYTTHAPLFVSMDHVDDIKLLSKRIGDSSLPRFTTVAETGLQRVASLLWEIEGKPGTEYTPDTLRPRLQVVMTPWMNEGFFADLVVLVEGEGDRSVVHAVAKANGYDLEAKGICVIPCRGKAHMHRPAVIFKNLEIPTYLIWDNDSNCKPNEKEQNRNLNRRLLKLVEATETDWPTGVWDTHSCLDGNLEKTLSAEMSESVFLHHRDNLLGEFNMRADRGGKKNPYVLRRVVEEAGEEGHVSETLNNIVSRIVGVLDACQNQ